MERGSFDTPQRLVDPKPQTIGMECVLRSDGPGPHLVSTAVRMPASKRPPLITKPSCSQTDSGRTRGAIDAFNKSAGRLNRGVGGVMPAASAVFRGQPFLSGRGASGAPRELLIRKLREFLFNMQIQ